MVPPVDMLRPAGRPVAEKVYGPPAPPEAVMVTGVIATPSTAMMLAQVALTGGLTLTEQLNVPVAPLAVSVTVTVLLKVPLTVGVPEMVPPVDIVRPAGRPVAEKVYGPPAPPDAVMVTGVIAMPSTAMMVAQ